MGSLIQTLATRVISCTTISIATLPCSIASLSINDKILCAGRVVGTKGGALLLMVTADGHIDPEFNDGKPVLTQEPFTAFEWIKLATQTDGSIVVVSARDCVIRRFLQNGQPDNSFVWATKPLRCSDIAIQPSSNRLIVTAKDNGGSALVLGLLSSSKVHK
jgi:hypothetical protein